MHKKLSIALGFMIFMFGFLKFFDPFKTWYSVQILTSGLPSSSYFLGIVGEIVVGLMLMLGFALRNEKTRSMLSVVGSLGLIGIMCVAVYVHLLPSVPADALPLKIKPPLIPAFFLIAAIYNLKLALGSFQLKPAPVNN